MTDDTIIARLTFALGDLAYPQLAQFKGNTNAIRRRLHALINLGVMAESTRNGIGPGLLPSAGQSVNDASQDAPVHNQQTQPPKKPKTRAFEKISFKGLDD